MIEENLFDNEWLSKIRKDQKDPWVMYFIIRKSLKMSPGKVAIQVAHGAQMIVFKYIDLIKFDVIRIYNPSSTLIKNTVIEKIDSIYDWKCESFRKILKKANDSKFEKIKEELDVFLVKDAGLTEVEPGSETVLVTWPMKKSNTPKIIEKLQLY